MKEKKREFLLSKTVKCILVSILVMTSIVYGIGSGTFASQDDIKVEFVEKYYDSDRTLSLEVNAKGTSENIEVLSIERPDSNIVFRSTTLYETSENGKLEFVVNYKKLNTGKVSSISSDHEVTGIKSNEASIQTRAIGNGSAMIDWEYIWRGGGGIILTKYLGNSKDIVIPGRLNGQQVFFQSGDIGNYEYNGFFDLFKGLGALNSVTIGTVASKVKFDKSDARSFFLKKFDPVDYEYKDTLKILDVSGLDTSNVTNMTAMFADIANIPGKNFEKVIGLSHLNVSKVSEMGALFENALFLTNLDELATWKDSVSNVFSMQSMFAKCRNLVSINGISDWNLSFSQKDVNCFYGAFVSCESLTSLKPLANWKNFNFGKNMYSAFDSCNSLTSLEGLENWSPIGSVSKAFANNPNLVNVDAISSWDASAIETASQLFENSPKIKNIDLSNWDVSKLFDTRSMFKNCNGLEKVDLGDWVVFDDAYYLNQSMFDITNDNTNPYLFIITTSQRIKKNFNKTINGRAILGPIYNGNAADATFDSGMTNVGYFGGFVHSSMPVDTEFTTTKQGVYNRYTPRRTGYKFMGWYTDSACNDGDEYVGTNEIIDLRNGSVRSLNLYAKWQKAEEIVTFDTQGGTFKDPTFTSLNINNGEKIDPLLIPDISHPNGWIFAGWYKDLAYTQLWNMNTDIVASHITLYAKWNKVGQGDSMVIYDNTNQIPDPGNPDNPDWAVQIPRSIQFTDTNKRFDIDVELVKTGTIELPDGFVDVKLRSEKGYVLEVGNTDPVKYTVKYDGGNILTGTNDHMIATLTKVSKIARGKAILTGDAKIVGLHTDRLIYTLSYRH